MASLPENVKWLQVSVETIKIDNGRTVPGAKYGSTESEMKRLVLTEAEQKVKQQLRDIWKGRTSTLVGFTFHPNYLKS